MTDTLTIQDVVRRTGLTSRALRFYEARGLLSPIRTYNDQRYYGPVQLERVHQIMTLKKAGLSLSQIGQLLNGRALDLAQMLKGQLAHLSAQAEEIETARQNLQTALSRIESGEPLDAATLCSLIKDGDKAMDQENWKKLIDHYYTPEEQAEWRANADDKLAVFNQKKYQEQWKALSGRIEAALPMDTGGKKALAFVREWFTLLEPFSKVATPKMWESTQNFYDKMPEWEREVDPGFSSTVWQFIMAAATAAHNAGHDIGPVPDWMKKEKS